MKCNDKGIVIMVARGGGGRACALILPLKHPFWGCGFGQVVRTLVWPPLANRCHTSDDGFDPPAGVV